MPSLFSIMQVKSKIIEQYNSTGGFYSAILFLVWPFLALISAFINYRSSWAKNILWAFVAFYGLAFAIGAESQGKDIIRYAAQIEYLHGMPMTLNDMVNYFMQNAKIDFLDTIIDLVVSRFTASQSVLTLVYGIIFGFFFSRNMWFVLERFKGKIRPITILLFSCFFLVIPFWYINGFRMWTATHIFIYGLFLFLFEKKWRGAFIASLSILVHFAFLVPVGVLFGYLLLGNRLIIYFVFFITTFFISEINLEAFNNIVETYAPEIVQEQTAGYRASGYVESYRQNTETNMVWYAVWYRRALNWAIMGFLVILFWRGRTFFQEHERWLRLFSFTLLFFGVANIMSSLPSGGRYITVAVLPALALIVMYVQNRKRERGMRQFIYLSTPALLLFVMVAVRIGLFSLSPTVLLGNPIVALFLTGEFISLNDVMNMIM